MEQHGEDVNKASRFVCEELQTIDKSKIDQQVSKLQRERDAYLHLNVELRTTVLSVVGAGLSKTNVMSAELLRTRPSAQPFVLSSVAWERFVWKHFFSAPASCRIKSMFPRAVDECASFQQDVKGAQCDYPHSYKLVC